MTARGSVKRRGDSWRGRYRDDSGKEHQRSFRTKTLATDWLDSELRKLATGSWVDPRAGGGSFGTYAAEWLKAQQGRANTMRLKEQRTRLYLLPVLADTPMRAIKRSHVQQVIAHCQQLGLTPLVTRYAVSQLRLILDSAVADKLVPVNVARDRTIALPRVEAAPQTVLTADHVQAIAANIRPRLKAAVLLAAATGLRSGELRALTVDKFSPPLHVLGDVLPQRCTITVDRQLTAARTMGPTKTGASVRTVTIGPGTIAALVAHVRQYGLGPGGLLFTGETGTDLPSCTMSLAWTGALAKCAKQGVEIPAGMTWHDLRHHHASTLLAARLNPAAIARRLGHSSARVTLDVYAHMLPTDDDAMVCASDAAAGAVRAGG